MKDTKFKHYLFCKNTNNISLITFWQCFGSGSAWIRMFLTTWIRIRIQGDQIDQNRQKSFIEMNEKNR